MDEAIDYEDAELYFTTTSEIRSAFQAWDYPIDSYVDSPIAFCTLLELVRSYFIE